MAIISRFRDYISCQVVDIMRNFAHYAKVIGIAK